MLDYLKITGKSETDRLDFNRETFSVLFELLNELNTGTIQPADDIRINSNYDREVKIRYKHVEVFYSSDSYYNCMLQITDMNLNSKFVYQYAVAYNSTFESEIIKFSLQEDEQKVIDELLDLFCELCE